MSDWEVIRTATKGNDGFHIETVEHGGFWLSGKYGVTPKPGDKVLVHVVNGSLIRGVDLNGKSLYYKSDEQLEAERVEWLADYKRQQLEDFEREKPQMDADYAALPKAFQRRIDRFRKDPKFRVESERYEMFCCTEAVKIANALGDPAKVKEFYDADWETQKRMVPGVSEDHSGNTFGGACALARAYLTDPSKL